MGKRKLSHIKITKKTLDDPKSFVIKYLHACLYDSTRVYMIENPHLGLSYKRGQNLLHMEGR